MKFNNLSVKRLFGRVAIGLILSMCVFTISFLTDEISNVTTYLDADEVSY